MGLIGRLWQIQCIYLDNEMQLTKKRKEKGKKRKKGLVSKREAGQ